MFGALPATCLTYIYTQLKQLLHEIAFRSHERQGYAAHLGTIPVELYALCHHPNIFSLETSVETVIASHLTIHNVGYKAIHTFPHDYFNTLSIITE